MTHTIRPRLTGALFAVGLTVSAQVIPRPPVVGGTPAALPVTTTSLTVGTTTTLSAGDRYVEAVTSPLTITPGSLVFLTVTRTAPDGYSGQLGVVEQVGFVASGV